MTPSKTSVYFSNIKEINVSPQEMLRNKLKKIELGCTFCGFLLKHLVITVTAT
jgi:hypothetical protein